MTKQTQKLERILLLDDSPEFLPKVDGVTLDVIQEALRCDSWFLYCNPGSGVYGSTPEKEAMIREVTSNKEVDYVVIGNNCGAGVRKAAAVAEDMRADKACVVWNSYQRGDEVEYSRLGFKHFMSRSDLAEHLEKYFKAKYDGTFRAQADDPKKDNGTPLFDLSELEEMQNELFHKAKRGEEK